MDDDLANKLAIIACVISLAGFAALAFYANILYRRELFKLTPEERKAFAEETAYEMQLW